MIDWNSTNSTDLELINECANRLVRIYPQFDKLTIEMDIAAAHMTNPLRLFDLLESDDFNFVHDVMGINKHIDRETGELLDCFLPRFSV